MPYQDTTSSAARAAELQADLVYLWPGSTPEDIIRRTLACVLVEDPDHRLRVAHLEPLLHLLLGEHTPCSSGRLQALLTDPSTAKIFPVDFNTQVSDWRSRVVRLDLPQLTLGLSAAKQHQQEQRQADTAAMHEPPHTQRGSSSGGSDGAAVDSHMLLADGTSADAVPQQHCAAVNGSSQAAGTICLGGLYGSGPALTGPAPHGHNSINVSADCGALHNSHSLPVPDSSSAMAGAGAPVSSLFGSSFEVPQAIASCWADHQSSFGSGVVGKHPNLEVLTAADGCGSSSIASGSSTRSFASPGAAAAAPIAALPARMNSCGSRLRNASHCHGDGLQSAAEPPAATSVDVSTPRSCMAVPESSSRSRLRSAEGEEEAEYSEAQLVFGSVTAAGGAAALAAASAEADGTGGHAEDGACGGAAGGAADLSPHSDGPAGGAAAAAAAAGPHQLEPAGSMPMQAVDWAHMAELLQAQQQQQQAEAALHQHQRSQQQLLFGLDELTADRPVQRSSSGGGSGGGAAAATTTGLPSAAPAVCRARSGTLAAAATGAMAARRLLMERVSFVEEVHAASPVVLGASQHSPHHLAALASSLGALGPGSAPAALQQQQHEQLMLAAATAAAAAGGSGAFGGLGGTGSFTGTAGGAERLMLEGDVGLQYGLSGAHHHLAALNSLQGTSYGSGGLLSDRSGGGGFWPSPSGMHHFLQHHQHQHQRQQAAAAAAVAAVAAAAAAHSQQQQQQHHGLGALGVADGSVDVGCRSDQMMKDGHQAAAAAAAARGKGPGGGMAPCVNVTAAANGHSAGSAEGDGGGGTGGGASALTPRLTGWASIAAKEPPPGSTAAQQQPAQQQQQGAGGAGAQAGMKQQQQGGGVGGGVSSKGVVMQPRRGKAVAKLPPRVKAEVQLLVTQFQGILKLEDFDDGVVHQLNAKHSEDEAVAAVRHIAHYELGSIQHMAAYLNHLVKHYNHTAATAVAAAAAAADTSVNLSNALAAAAAAAVAANSAAAAHGGGAVTAATVQQLLGASVLGGNGTLGSTAGSGRGGGGGGVAGAGGGPVGAYAGQIRLGSQPVSTKSMLQKLPLRVFKQIEALVQNCAYLEWRHFDAGVIKVLSQLSKLCQEDVFDELELLAATDLSNVEYMPAYLNKRLNNKLWSRRKAEGQVPG